MHSPLPWTPRTAPCPAVLPPGSTGHGAGFTQTTEDFEPQGDTWGMGGQSSWRELGEWVWGWEVSTGQACVYGSIEVQFTYHKPHPLFGV